MDAPKSIKRGKVMDKSLPPSLARAYGDYKLYDELTRAERKLDWTVARKRAELQDSLSRSHTTRKILRVFISHTCKGQSWQTMQSDQNHETVDFQSGEGIPSWTLKIEGRLLQANLKFSSVLKAIAIELERDPQSYVESNHSEWVRSQGQSDQDGFTMTRRGDMTTKARIVLHVDQTPERYKLSPMLADLLQMKEGSRASIINAVWSYVKIHKLQDKVDRRSIKTDVKLRAISGLDALAFQQLPELIDRNIMPPDPFILPYTISVEPGNDSGSHCFDLELELDDNAYKSVIVGTLSKIASNYAANLAVIDDEIAQGAQAIRTAKLKQDFYLALSEDPRGFVNKWLESQSKDLDLVLGNEYGVREEDLKKTDFFSQPWIDDAVSIQEGLRVAGALQRMQEGR